jgi:hypothetical protein
LGRKGSELYRLFYSSLVSHFHLFLNTSNQQSLSEFGCIENPPRTWGEIPALYSDKMTSVYSGGLVYEYTMGDNKFGVVEVAPNAGPVKELPEFSTLASAFKNNPAPSGNGGYREDLPASQCPPPTAIWKVANDTLPAMPAGAKKFMDSGAGAGQGLKEGDKGSQWAGTPSKGWETAGNSPSDKKKKNGSASLTVESIQSVAFVLFGILAMQLL